MSKQYEITGCMWKLQNHIFQPSGDVDSTQEGDWHQGDIVTYVGWASDTHVLVKALYANKWFHGVIPTQYLREIVPVTAPAPVDRTQWQEGIEQVQGYLPSMPERTWDYLQDMHRPLYDGLRKMQHNGPDND